MAAYYMTIAGSDIRGSWEPCKADTLTGAKREASRRFGGGFRHHRILIGAGDGVREERIVIATRPLSESIWYRGA